LEAENEKVEQAALFLQRLLRGRLAQADMWQGIN
jgi:hypothetical protein